MLSKKRIPKSHLLAQKEKQKAIKQEQELAPNLFKQAMQKYIIKGTPAIPKKRRKKA